MHLYAFFSMASEVPSQLTELEPPSNTTNQGGNIGSRDGNASRRLGAASWQPRSPLSPSPCIGGGGRRFIWRFGGDPAARQMSAAAAAAALAAGQAAAGSTVPVKMMGMNAAADSASYLPTTMNSAAVAVAGAPAASAVLTGPNRSSLHIQFR